MTASPKVFGIKGFGILHESKVLRRVSSTMSLSAHYRYDLACSSITSFLRIAQSCLFLLVLFAKSAGRDANKAFKDMAHLLTVKEPAFLCNLLYQAVILDKQDMRYGLHYCILYSVISNQ